MKKLLAFLLVLSLLLAGCGAQQSEAEVAGKVEPATQPMEADETAQSTEEATEAATEEPVVTMGSLEGGVYTNDYAGYACELDSSWLFYGAEDLQDLPENVQELVADTELGDILEGVSQFTDMMAENVDEMVTMNVLYQKQSMQKRVAFAMLSEEEILDATLEQKDLMLEAYTQAGMDVQTMEKVKVTFLGEERLALRTVGTTQEIPFVILQVFDYHLGQYSVTLTVTSYIEDKTQQTLELFYPVS